MNGRAAAQAPWPASFRHFLESGLALAALPAYSSRLDQGAHDFADVSGCP